MFGDSWKTVEEIEAALNDVAGSIRAEMGSPVMQTRDNLYALIEAIHRHEGKLMEIRHEAHRRIAGRT
jgi:hypothetical protein